MSSPTRLDDAERAWQRGDVLAAMQACDQLDAAMIGLIYFRGFGFHQVAEHLRLPIAAVQAGVARGMSQLGNALMQRLSQVATEIADIA